ncbi:MAG: hypothetical protein GEV08_13290 [Acidimicrobiia bacterium]|nr:hypothetical protein [Acidimicrobiia bacterium]
MDVEAARAQGQAYLAATEGAGATLSLDDALALLAHAGVRAAEQRWASSLDEALDAAAGIGYPVALKAAGRPKVARTEATGLALDLVAPEDLAASFRRMAAVLGSGMDRVLVQAMRPVGADVQLVAGTHPRLGPVVALGRGGSSGSPPDELALRLAPLSPVDAARLVSSSVLQGTVAPGALTELLQRVSMLVAEVPEVAEVRLDPVLVSDTTVSVTDVLVRVAPWVPDPRPPVRRL